VQLLWTNMATDSLPALALGVDPAEEGMMDRPPRGRGEGIMTRESISRIVARGSVLMFGTLGAYLGVLVLHGVPLSHEAFAPQYAEGVMLAQTAAFTALVFQKLLFSLTFRSLEHSIFSRATLANPLLLGAIAVGALMQLVVVYFPGAETIFRTVPLGLAEWQIMAPAIVLPVLVIDAVKVIRARRAARSAVDASCPAA
jgi:Ca2+-transporting ATPase